MYSRNLFSCGGLASSASCVGGSFRSPDEIISKYVSTVGEKSRRAEDASDEVFAFVIPAAIVMKVGLVVESADLPAARMDEGCKCVEGSRQEKFS